MTTLEVSGRSYGGAGLIVRALKVLAQSSNEPVSFLISQGECQGMVLTKLLGEIEALKTVTQQSFPIEVHLEDINGSAIKIPA
jgi:hypothetical protein